MSMHERFLQRSLQQSLLASPPFLCSLVKVMETALSLARYVSIQFSGTSEEKPMEPKVVSDSIGKHQRSFEAHLRRLDEFLRTQEDLMEDIPALLFQLDLLTRT